jgi:Ser/Thr protein kinase RdoA (MazF antagonist)
VTDEPLQRLEAVARDALLSYDIRHADLTLLNISENATYAVDDLDTGRRTVLRVNRPGYHTREAIESELAWIAAIRQDGVLRTPQVLATSGGELVGVGRNPDREARHTVMFEWVPGAEPPEDRLVEDFVELGAITARLHEHARRWQRPVVATARRRDSQRGGGAAMVCGLLAHVRSRACRARLSRHARGYRHLLSETRPALANW